MYLLAAVYCGRSIKYYMYINARRAQYSLYDTILIGKILRTSRKSNIILKCIIYGKKHGVDRIHLHIKKSQTHPK